MAKGKKHTPETIVSLLWQSKLRLPTAGRHRSRAGKWHLYNTNRSLFERHANHERHNVDLGHEIDIMPTCLAAAGTSLPTTTASGNAPLPLEGKGLLPILHGRPISNRGMLFWEHEDNCAVRDGKWKLVSAFPDTWELYDMDADRAELHNLADAMPERVNTMSDTYRSWAKRVGAQPWPMPGTPQGERSG